MNKAGLAMIALLLLAGCQTYNAETVCETYCGGKPLMHDYSTITEYIVCTSEPMNNVTSLKQGNLDVQCIMPDSPESGKK